MTDDPTRRGGRKATGTVVTIRNGPNRGCYQGIVTMSNGKRKRLRPVFALGTSLDFAKEKTAYWAERYGKAKIMAAPPASPYRLKTVPPPETAGVYVVTDGKVRGKWRVKIGKAENVARRVRELQCGHPDPLGFLGLLSSNKNDEARFHRLFKKSHLRGEWFALTGDIARHILSSEAA
jgi:hypothetical protein